jgi:hypothetical protein
MVNNVTNHAANLWITNGTKQSPSQMFALPQNVFSNTELKTEAFVAMGFRVPGGGFMSANVFKSENFCEEDPIMLVKGINVCGTPFEKEININNIVPHNASFVELLAFDGFTAATGNPSQVTRIAARALMMQELNGKEFSDFNAFTLTDFAAALRGLIASTHSNQNYETLLWLNSNTEPFFTKFGIEK